MNAQTSLFNKYNSETKINEFEGRLANKLIAFRKELSDLHKAVNGEFHMWGDLDKNQRSIYHRRIRLLRVYISDMLKLLRDDEKYG